MDKLKTTNTLLLIIVIPLIFYILKLLSFIFIPLVFSMFLALLFLPLMRWLGKKKITKPISLFIVILIIAVLFKIGGELVHYSSKELMSVDNTFIEKAETKLSNLVITVENYFGIERAKNTNAFSHYFKKEVFTKHIGSTLDFLSSTLSMILMTAFFLVLWLLESINIQKVLNKTILKQQFSSVKVFMKIEKDLIKFMKVKFIISLFTGIGITLACMYFDVSFPIFWGLFAFIINFVQMVGSFITVILLTLFAIIELDPTTTLLFFIISITGVQVLMGGILEPVFMGKSFSINVITILVMLSLWGYIWGIPGMIMAIPLTVFIKIVAEQFDKTKIIANLISGSNQ
ncbi:MAG: AI-2E family transporter [Flavobacteriaceae bacterium]